MQASREVSNARDGKRRWEKDARDLQVALAVVTGDIHMVCFKVDGHQSSLVLSLISDTNVQSMNGAPAQHADIFNLRTSSILRFNEGFQKAQFPLAPNLLAGSAHPASPQ